MLHGAFLARFGGAWIGHVAEWLRSGLQIRAPRFDSGRGLHNLAPELSTVFLNVSPLTGLPKAQEETDGH
jgi:hypothetical protein